MYDFNFGDRLSRLRAQRAVSAREMSLAIGQNCSYINRIENHVALPSMQAFFYICEYLDVTPKEFFDTDTPVPVQLRNLEENLKRLTPEQLSAVQNIVQNMLPQQ